MNGRLSNLLRINRHQFVYDAFLKVQLYCLVVAESNDADLLNFVELGDCLRCTNGVFCGKAHKQLPFFYTIGEQPVFSRGLVEYGVRYFVLFVERGDEAVHERAVVRIVLIAAVDDECRSSSIKKRGGCICNGPSKLRIVCSYKRDLRQVWNIMPHGDERNHFSVNALRRGKVSVGLIDVCNDAVCVYKRRIVKERLHGNILCKRPRYIQFNSRMVC